MYKNPCFDSSVFLGGLNQEIVDGVKRGVVFSYLLERARAREFTIHIATVAIAEVFQSKTYGMQSGAACLNDFMSLLEDNLLQPIEVDRETGINAHKLCRQFNVLRPFDALHVACAEAAGCDYLLTWDKKLTKVNNTTLKIEAPCIYARNLLTESELANPAEQAAWNANNRARRKILGRDFDLEATCSEGLGI